MLDLLREELLMTMGMLGARTWMTSTIILFGKALSLLPASRIGDEDITALDRQRS